MSAVGSKKKNLKRHCETTMCRDVCKVHKLEKKDVTNSVRSQRVLELTSNLEQTRQMYLKLCTLGESQRATCLGRILSLPTSTGIPRITRGRGIFLLPRLPVKGLDVLALNFAWTLAAAGDVAVVGCRRWRDVQVICCRGVVQCWVLQSSITCFAYCLSFFFPPVDMFSAATSHVFLFARSLL